MKIKFIGSGDAFGTAGKGNTCILLKSNLHGCILLDIGASAMPALKKSEIDLLQVSTILITHFHGDHFGGLPQFLLDAQIILQRTHPLTIVGPKGLVEKVWQLQEAMYPGTSDLEYTFPINFIEMNHKEHVFNEKFKVEYWPMIHSAKSNPHGVRLFIDDFLIAYTGDTEWQDSIIAFADKCNILVMECFSFEEPSPMHLNYEVIMRNLNKLRSDRIILTHLGPSMIDNIQTSLLEIAQDGLEIDLYS